MDKKRKVSRPRSHTIETEQRIAFETLVINAGWLYRRTDSDDYGIDGQVEIFDQGVRTGLIFSVQLKATDKVQTKFPRKVSLKKSDSEYWSSMQEPVLLVYWFAATRSMQWAWISKLIVQADDIKDLWQFGIACLSNWGPETPSILVSDLIAERQLSGSLVNPLKICLKINPPLHDLSANTLFAELKKIEVSQSAWLKFVNQEEEFTGSVVISSNFIHVGVGLKYSFTCKYENFTNRDPGSMAADAFFYLGLSLCKAGQTLAGTRLISSSVIKTYAIGMPLHCFSAISMLIQAGRLQEAETLFERLIDLAPDARELPDSIWSVPPYSEALAPGTAVWLLRLQERLIRKLLHKYGVENAIHHLYALAISSYGPVSDERVRLLSEIAEVTNCYDEDPVFWQQLARANIDVGNSASALSAIERSEKLRPKKYNNVYRMMALSQLGQFKLAKQALDLAEPEPLLGRWHNVSAWAVSFASELGLELNCSSKEETLETLLNLWKSSDQEEQYVIRIACLLLIMAIQPTNPAVLTELIREAVDHGLNPISEMCIDLMAEILGRKFPQIMSDYTAGAFPNLSPDQLAKGRSAWEKKLEQLRTGGEWPREHSLRLDDGSTLRIWHDGSSGWQEERVDHPN